MITAKSILESRLGDKGLATVPAHATVGVSVQAMVACKCGAVLILDDKKNIAGIFTERDLVRKIVGCGLDPHTEKVADHMSTDIIVAKLEDPIRQVIGSMDTRHIRHLPIVDDDGKLIDMISSQDIMHLQLSVCENQIQHLEDYISGETY